MTDPEVRPGLFGGPGVVGLKEQFMSAISKTEHPLASPTELAGSTEGAIAAEFAARDAEEAIQADADATDAEREEDSLPLDGE